ncbi:MAG: VWA domain-containing protein [Myxococcales bacterium]|nr:VWA domain-containing protein [Myxococcales bacterium]
MPTVDPARVEALGPAERVLQTLVIWTDHLVHHRPGFVVPDRSSPTGTRWAPVTTREHKGERVVEQLVRRGRKNDRVRLGTLRADGAIVERGRVVGHYRPAGIYPEVGAWMFRQVAEVFALDNALVAHWASWAFEQDHRDLKVVLAAFLLVQDRTGQPVRGDDGAVIFFDDDYRDVGEAMCLIRRKDKKDLHPKLLLRVGELLSLKDVAALCRERGWGRGRGPVLGRWPRVVEKWLLHRERNPRLLEGLVKAGFRTSVIELARRVGYKPETPAFFDVLRWRQTQAKDGRRTLAIGAGVRAAESWEGLSEGEICERIVETRPDYKRIVGLLPRQVGLTRAIVAAAMDAGSLSDTDLLILTPTLEELGLLEVPLIRDRWRQATEAATNQRAANVAARVRRKENAEVLQQASDAAVRKALEEVVADLRVYVMVDKSGSMEGAIERAKVYLSRFLQGFPLDRLHVSIFNTTGTEIVIRHPSAAGVEHAFKGHAAGGGTVYGAGVRALQHHQPKEGEDVLFLFVGDQADGRGSFVEPVVASGLNPVAFGMLEVIGSWGTRGKAVEETASRLGIPCFRIDEDMFGDAYAVTRVLRDLIASTPVGVSTDKTSKRAHLVETMLRTPLLEKPAWAGR